MSEDPFAVPFPAVERKKVTAAFDGGRITSDGGVMLLAAAERRLGIAERLAYRRPPRPDLVTHSVADILRARISPSPAVTRMPTISIISAPTRLQAGLRWLPDSGDDLCSQPTVSRWENAPTGTK